MSPTSPQPSASGWRFGVLAKFSAGFLALLACACLLGLLALTRLNAVETAARELRGHWLPTTRALGEISYLAQRFRVIEASVLLAPTNQRSAEIETLKAIRGEIETAFTRQARFADSDVERDDLARLKTAWTAYLALDDHFLTVSDDSAATLYRAALRNGMHDFQNALKVAQQHNVAEADAATQRGEAEGAAAHRDLWLGIAFTTLLSVAIGALLQGAIVRPLRNVTQAVRALAGGETRVEIPYLARRDEIGELAQASEVFKRAAARHSGELAAEAAKVRAEAARTRDDAAAERERAAAVREKAMGELGLGLRALAAGDLRRALSADFPPEFEALRRDFEDAREKLAAALLTVAQATSALSAECGSLGEGAQELSSRTERQAANLEESSAALQQISATVRQSSSQTDMARGAAAAANGEAQRAAGVVAEAVAAMDGLSRASAEIREITGLIDEIAFQTNLLALNAGVEAARAGDSGRGFAVVATEVRALAARSADMAKRISHLIGNSDAQVKRGVERVGATGAALERIGGDIARLNATLEAMAAAAADQARALSEVSGAVSEMDAVTQSNAAMVSQTHDATRRLVEEIGRLEDRVGEFNLGAVEQRRAA